MALHMAVQAARRRINGKQPPQLPPVPPPPIAPLPPAVRRRLVGKRPDPAAPIAMHQAAISRSALAAEAWAEVTSLAEDAQRQHVHYTHVQTKNPLDRQPDTYTRKQFYLHLEKCYVKAYPEAANPSGSILLFGAVAKEFPPGGGQVAADGPDVEHHHCATYTSKRHYWKKVADISYKEYRVKLNAIAHDGYYSMYSYITKPSAKKTLADLDGERFLSKNHPRGKELSKLLEAGEVHARALQARKRKLEDVATDTTGLPTGKRIRSGDVYAIVSRTGSNVRTALDLQSLAAKTASQGDSRLAEFCTAMGQEKLERLVHGAVSVLGAPENLRLKESSRMELFRQAASKNPCECKGVWIPGVLWILGIQKEPVGAFCRDVCRALEVGARRGTNFAIVGEPGCGKSTPFEPFDGIFPVMGKPESKSSFPLAGALDARLLLWQDYKHNDNTVLFEDLLSFIVGEQVNIRVPCKKNVPFRNNSPLFLTSNSHLRVVREDPEAMRRLNEAAAERFCTRLWTVALPRAQRNPDFPKCSRCCANFFLMYR